MILTILYGTRDKKPERFSVTITLFSHNGRIISQHLNYYIHAGKKQQSDMKKLDPSVCIGATAFRDPPEAAS